MRRISYNDAIREAIKQSMEEDESVFVYGEGVDFAKGVFGIPLDLAKEFGDERVFDIPMSENALTGVGIGAAINGMRPIMVHQRIDFTLLALDQICNHAAKACYMWGGNLSVPLVIRAIVGRGWGQGANHSQSFHSIFTHFPGLKVVLPSNAYDAKGLLIQSIRDENPVIFVEHKFLFGQEDEVPEEIYAIPLGKGRKVRKGKDVTIVAFSQMVLEAKKAAEELSNQGIDVEIIDPRTSYPLDEKIIADSVKKTGKLIIADIDWLFCGITAEISARITENYFSYLKAPIKRIGLPHATHPCSYALEDVFYPTHENIIKAVKEVVRD
ncbi:MAG: alpha-ketoacid dehydrogenase subunit beta [Thermoplasmatales archaeon]|nr:alpha-ketoacid dehydrogenase subunit beta [Thermoplasmatales archaeon]